MNKKYTSETDSNNADYDPSFYNSKYCVACARDQIEFWPAGVGQGVKHLITVNATDKSDLDGQITKTIFSSVDAIEAVPFAAVRDLIEFYNFLCDPSQQRRIEKDIKRDNFYEAASGKYCHLLPDNGIEICVGEFRHRVGPEALTGLGGDLGFLLEELRHKPWFNDEVRLDVCEVFAARGVSEYMRKL